MKQYYNSLIAWVNIKKINKITLQNQKVILTFGKIKEINLELYQQLDFQVLIKINKKGKPKLIIYLYL